MGIDSGIVAAIHQKIACTQGQFDRNEMWVTLQGHEELHFEELYRARAELWYPDEQLIVNQRKTMRKGQCIEGVFLAKATARLPGGLRHGQTVNIQFSMTNHLGDCYSTYFPLRIEELKRKKPDPMRGNIRDRLIINGEHEQAPEKNESAWSSPLIVPPVPQSGRRGEER
jgi:hypothetical protein